MTAPLFIPGHSWQANSYLLGTTLIDAGVTPDKIAPFKDKIQTIILTHGHFDHTAHATEIARLCNAEIYIGEHELALLRDPASSLSARFAIKQQNITARPLRDGDVINGLTVFHTPGHTKGSICLFRETDGVLIAGDTLFPNGSYGRTDLPTGSETDLAASIDRLAALPVQSMWCGHEQPVTSDAKRHIAISQADIHRYA